MIQAPGATPEELAAIIAVLSSRAHGASATEVEGEPLAWALAARYPEAEFDELRAIVCSIRS